MADAPPIGPVPDTAQHRYEALQEKHQAKYGKRPQFFIRAPGRVNLIGEHIDYCGYAVLPMAIEQDIIFAASSDESGKICLANTKDEYKPFECDVSSLAIDKSNPQWHNYVLCGVKGMLEYKEKEAGSPQGFQAMVEGTVPRSAGLSSSSALVCAAALTTAYSNGWTVSKKDLADLCASCERYIGTEGGGMDQAICFMAKQGTAKLIEFNPLRATDVRLPEGAVFVISNSCVELNKAATSHFNIRVVECRIAAQLLGKAHGLEWQKLRRLGDVQKQLDVSLEDMMAKVKEVMHEEPYTKEEICTTLGVTPEALAETTLTANTLDVDTFRPHQRALHVYGEANRVLKFKVICDQKMPDALKQLGKLMSNSHASCRDLYECSHPDLDTLVNICMESGALGSRLTGAGWGGCAVSMVPSDKVMAFLTKVKKSYYDSNPQRAARVKESLFATQPGSGATIYLPEGSKEGS